MDVLFKISSVICFDDEFIAIFFSDNLQLHLIIKVTLLNKGKARNLERSGLLTVFKDIHWIQFQVVFI